MFGTYRLRGRFSSTEGSQTHLYLIYLIALLTVGARVLAGPANVDDAYITFRYAQNLSHGFGFTYNPGEWVLGTSAPLYGLLLAAMRGAGVAEVPQASLWLNALADATSCVLIGAVGRELGWPNHWRVIAAAHWAIYPLCARYSLGGMESSLAATLVLAAWLALLRGSAVTSTTLLALGCLFRPDVVVITLATMAYVLLKRVPGRARAIMVAVLIGGIWVGVATWHYGSPIPQSVTAKSGAVYSIPPWKNAQQIGFGLLGLVDPDPSLAAKGLQTSRPGVGFSTFEVMVLSELVAVLGVSIYGLSARWSASLPFMGGLVVTLFVFAAAAVRSSVMAEWYIVPYASLLVVALFSGLSSISTRLRKSSVAVAGIGVLIPALQLSAYVGPEFKWHARPDSAWTERESEYFAAAVGLRPLLRPNDVVAAPEIGAFGYACDCRILDTVGLVSPRATAYRASAAEFAGLNYAVPSTLMKAENPAFLLSLDVFVRHLVVDPWFIENYHEVWSADSQAFGSHRLVAYERRR